MSVDFTVDKLPKPTRLDRVLRQRFPRWGRQAVGRIIQGRKVRVNGRTVWLASWTVHNGDRIQVSEPPAPKPVPPGRFQPEWLIRDDGDLLAVDKPAGLLAEPPRHREAANLLSLTQRHFDEELILFHRLDRDTSGVLLLTRPGPINAYLDAAFKAGTVHKEYVALVHAPNRLKLQGQMDARLTHHPKRRDMMVVTARGGKHALTDYAVEAEYTLEPAGELVQRVRLWPKTGRTHQLRVHLAHLGAPIVGDRLYGPGADPAGRLCLHAHRLQLPAGDDFPARDFVAPLPALFAPPEG